jgi:hypothetical protein
MVVGFTTTDIVSSNFDQGEVYNIIWLCDCHEITEILLTVTLNMIKQINKLYIHDMLDNKQTLYPWHARQ